MVKTCFSILFPFITFPYISRVLLANNIGKVNFGSSYVVYYSLIASLGITTYAIRECAAVKNDKNKLSNIASQIYSINIITTFVAYILLFLSLIIFRKLDNYRELIIIQSTVILFTTLGADWLNSAMEDFKYITIRTIAFQVISLILMFIFVHKSDDYIKYALITVLSSSGANIMNILYRKRYCKVRFTSNIDWKKHIVPIMLLFVMILSQTIFNTVDVTMLGLIKGDYEVGIFSSAQKMSSIINQLISSLMFVIMPKMSYLFAEGDYNKINKLLRKVLGFNILIGLPCVVGVACLSEDIIFIIAGKGFLQAAPVLSLLMIALFWGLFGGNFLGNAVLLPSKGEKYYMIVCCITAMVNIILNAILIPIFGAYGAASTTAFCGFLIFILLFFKVDKRIKIENLHSLFYAPIIGCLLIFTVCFVLRVISNIYIRSVVSILCSGIIYGIAVIILKNDIALEVIIPLKNKICNIKNRN